MRVAAWHACNASSTMAAAVSGRWDSPSKSGSVKGPRSEELLEEIERDDEDEGMV